MARFAALALALVAVLCVLPGSLAIISFAVGPNYTCPTNPLSPCSFYFAGKKGAIPEISLTNAIPDTPLTPAVLSNRIPKGVVFVSHSGPELLYKNAPAGTNKFGFNPYVNEIFYLGGKVRKKYRIGTLFGIGTNAEQSTTPMPKATYGSSVRALKRSAASSRHRAKRTEQHQESALQCAASQSSSSHNPTLQYITLQHMTSNCSTGHCSTVLHPRRVRHVNTRQISIPAMYL